MFFSICCILFQQYQPPKPKGRGAVGMASPNDGYSSGPAPRAAPAAPAQRGMPTGPAGARGRQTADALVFNNHLPCLGT